MDSQRPSRGGHEALRASLNHVGSDSDKEPVYKISRARNRVQREGVRNFATRLDKIAVRWLPSMYLAAVPSSVARKLA
jgi:hypothetical protein